MSEFLRRIGITLPIIQAPMAGISTPELAAAVTEAGGLGSIGVGATDAPGAHAMIEKLRELTEGPFNVNVFCHEPAVVDREIEQAWLVAMREVFRRLDAEMPTEIGEIYRSFKADQAMLEVLLETRPAVVSFHFGLPSTQAIARLKAAGIVLFSTATTLPEAQAAVDAGLDAVVAQGFEAGGHRGAFDPDAPDSGLGVMALTRLLVRRIPLPVIAAGAIMDGAGIAAALALGAAAAQLGTAFVGCPESAADDYYRGALLGPGSTVTVMTRTISGRPARCIANAFTALDSAELAGLRAPAYPIAYDAGKRLNAAGKHRADGGFGAHWAGQGAPLSRVLPAGALVRELAAEFMRASRAERVSPAP